MSEEVTRRFFLIGSAAAVAVASLPKVAAPPLVPEEVVRLPAALVYKRRLINELRVSFDLSWELIEDQAVKVRLMRGDVCLRADVVHVRYSWHWVAMGDHEMIVLTPADSFRIDVEFTKKEYPARVQLICRDYIDEGPPVMVMEDYTIVDGKASVVPHFLEVDNSLEARLERKRQAEGGQA